ncbi:SCO2524 family protein [Actinospica robiniae]|uniref:SCO2524 family protein n=1 Tax=Actinospica robiniae TaxID=304901 RepID=UPI000403E42F|nr:SCO2524 family protein [Actinospica robiniae]
MPRTQGIQPRREIIEVWQALARHVYADRRWRWDGVVAGNSVSDAELLLCILLPATAIPELALSDPNDTSEDVLAALAPLGDSTQIPRSIVQALEEFCERYTLPDGAADFSAGPLLALADFGTALTRQQREIELTASHAISVHLCIAALAFTTTYRSSAARGVMAARVDRLILRISSRLTQALVGLLRSFCMNPIEPDSSEGQDLFAMLDQGSATRYELITRFNDEMAVVRARLSEARLGVARFEELDNPNLLFELGWTWGVADSAPRIELYEDGERSASIQREGLAQSTPDLHFTMEVLDAIGQLESESTRVLGLLDPEQERLANALLIRRDLCRLYWSTLARFDEEYWPVEDIPWRATDGVESDYFTLLMCGVVIGDVRIRAANEDDVARLVPLLEELAERSRITRRPLRGDQALDLHHPGIGLALPGRWEPDGEEPRWRVTDFAAALLKRTVELAGLTASTTVRDQLFQHAANIWGHLRARSFTGGPALGLWDDPGRVFPELPPAESAAPSLAATYHVVDALVATWSAQATRVSRASGLGSMAEAMVSEAGDLLNQELIRAAALSTPFQSALQELQSAVNRAKDLVDGQPASAIALVVTVLHELDMIGMARADASRAV